MPPPTARPKTSWNWTSDVAQLAIADMKLTAINIGIAPKAEDGRIGLVGMPIWMWVNNPDAHTWGPATASATAGGITVTATARVHQITWDMGDGHTVTCRTAGTPGGTPAAAPPVTQSAVAMPTP